MPRLMRHHLHDCEEKQCARRCAEVGDLYGLERVITPEETWPWPDDLRSRGERRWFLAERAVEAARQVRWAKRCLVLLACGAILVTWFALSELLGGPFDPPYTLVPASVLIPLAPRAAPVPRRARRHRRAAQAVGPCEDPACARRPQKLNAAEPVAAFVNLPREEASSLADVRLCAGWFYRITSSVPTTTSGPSSRGRATFATANGDGVRHAAFKGATPAVPVVDADRSRTPPSRSRPVAD